MRHNDCIFFREDDCPKESINITCEQCEENKLYEEIERATRDFVSLGDDFTALFEMCFKLFNTKEVFVPKDSIRSVNRVITALLSKENNNSAGRQIYKRMIVYLFGIIIDEFKNEEYDQINLTH